jgi:hypothetical protein
VSQKVQTAVRAVLLATGPEIAPGEPAEDGGATGLEAFALQRIEELLYRIQMEEG